MPSKDKQPTSFTDHVFYYMVFCGLNIEQALSKAEGDLCGNVPAQVKALTRKELENVGRI